MCGGTCGSVLPAPWRLAWGSDLLSSILSADIIGLWHSPSSTLHHCPLMVAPETPVIGRTLSTAPPAAAMAPTELKSCPAGVRGRGTEAPSSGDLPEHVCLHAVDLLVRGIPAHGERVLWVLHAQLREVPLEGLPEVLCHCAQVGKGLRVLVILSQRVLELCFRLLPAQHAHVCCGHAIV